MGLLNQSGFVYYSLTNFNDSTINYSINKASAFNDSSIGIHIPKNATILSAFMNISGYNNIGETDDSISLPTVSINGYDTGYLFGLDYNGTHFFTVYSVYNGTSGAVAVVILNNSGNNVSSFMLDGLQNGNYQEIVSNGSRIFVASHYALYSPSDSISNYTNSGIYGGKCAYSYSNSNSNTIESNGTHFFVVDEVSQPSRIVALNIVDCSISDWSISTGIIGGYTNTFLPNEQQYIYVAYANQNIYRFKMSDGSSSIIPISQTAVSLAGDSKYFYTIGSFDNTIYKIFRGNLPSNVTLNINGTLFFNYTTDFGITNGTINFNDYLQDALSDCIPKSDGNCDLPINITSSSSGKVSIHNLQVNYTYNISSYMDVTNFTNKTSDFTPQTYQSILKKFKFPSFPTTDLNITGFFVSDTATGCWIDGIVKNIGINSFHKYCNLTTSQYLDSSGGLWTNHSLFDDTMISLGTYSPVNQTNSTRMLNNTIYLKYFNVTSYLPNGSIANDTLGDIIYNITTEINISDTSLSSKSAGYTQGVKWFNQTDWVALNTTNRCAKGLLETETNYSNITLSGLLWQSCFNDTNNNDVNDYFKVLIPQLSLQQFYVYGQFNSLPSTPNITYPINNSNLSNVKSINFTSSDADGDILTYYIYANNVLNITSTSNITQWNASDGRYYISVSAYDGTDFSSNTTINFTLDSTPPATTSTMTSPPDGASYTNNTWSSSNIKVTLSAFDALIGYNNLKFPMYCTDIINACYPSTYIGAGATITAEGTNYFRYYSNDTLNNSETVKFEVLKIDKYVPTVNTTFNATPYINDFINFTGNITDSVGLLSANITYNMSGFITYANYTLSGTSAQVSNATQLVGNGGTVINFTMFVTDTANQVKQNSTLVTIIDNVMPIVNTSFNTTNPVIGSVINFTGNVTDETGLLMANWTVNLSTGKVYANYSISGTSAQISNVTTLTRVDVVNFTLYVTDTSNNVKQNSTIITVTDNIFPIVNTTFNVTNAKVADIVNYTANITDETGLLMANWTVNLSTGKVYANYSISGTSAQISNATDLSSCVETCVLNFTIYATDTSNNVKQNSTLLSIADITTPIVNTTFNTTSPTNVDFINFTGNVTDGVGLLYANWTVNLSTGKVFMNYSISGTSAQISNTTNLYGLPAQVLNFTLYATDTSNNVKQNSTVLSVSDAIKPVVNTSFNISNPTVNQVINFTGNITDETGLLFANWTVNLSTGKIFMNYSISGTSAQISNLTQLTTGIFNFTLYATDTSNNVRQNSTIITVTDNVKPVGNATLNSSVIRINDWINSTINITDESKLQTANLTINFTTGKTFSNYSISGTEAQLSNLTQILASRGNVLNFSWIISDAAGNIQQNDTIITIANTLPASPNILFPVSWSNYSNVTYLNYTSQADADSDAITYKVYINGTLNHSVSTNITQFNASDGFYNLTVFANDGDNSSNATVYFTLDTTPPVLNLISPYNGYIYTSLILDLNHSVYDSMVGLSSCWYQNGTSAPQNFTIDCNTNTTIQASAAGTNTTYFWANDTVGNVVSASTTYTISLGSPAVNTLFPINNTWYNYNQNVSFNFTVDDPNDNGIRNCSLYGNWSNGNFIFNGTNTTNIVENQRYNITRNLTDGWYMYNVECWDITDNFFGWDANNKTFGIDATFPQINFTGLTLDNNTNTTATSIFINVSTNESNFNSITFELHNPDGLVSSVKFTELTNNITFAGLSDNTYYYNVTINDSAGNRNTTETRLIRLDDTSPSITLNHPQAQNYGYNNSLSLNYTVSDNVVGISSCWYYVYNSSGSLMIPSTTLANCQNSTFSLHGGSDTDYTLTLFSNDLLGNVNSQAVTFGIRMVSPAVVLDNPTNNQYFNNLSDIRLNFTPTDNDGISDCELWGNWSGEWKINQTNNSITSGVQYNFNKINVSLDEYGYKWNVWCNDTINNSDFALNNFTFYTDTKIPNASLISPSSTTYTSLSLGLQHIESDYSLNTCKYNYIVGGAESANTTVTCNVNQTLTLTAYGTYLFNYYVTDRANNINHTQLNFTTQAPAVDGGKGGGGGSSLAPEKIIERNLTIQVERCGNFVCEECDSNSPEGCVDETPLSCPLDCKAFSFDEMFCTPIFNCGNWKLAWFTNSAILLVASGMVYMQYKISRLKKMKKKRL